MKILIIFSLCLCSAHVFAGEPFPESELQTLFTTPADRLAIDRRRTERAPGPEVQQRRAPNKVTVNGVVKSSDGSSTVWVNGKSNLDRRTVNGVKVLSRQRKPDSVAVYVDGNLVHIKPGETWSDKQQDRQSDN